MTIGSTMTSPTPTEQPADASVPDSPTASSRLPGTSEELTGGRPLRRYLLWFGIATAAITSVWGGVSGIILPNHVQLLEFARIFTGTDAHVNLLHLTNLKAAVDAGTTTATPDQLRQLGLLKEFEASRAQAVAVVGSIGTILTMLAQPIIGVLSDRTRSRFGRRAPWILLGGVFGAFFLAAIRFSPSVAVLVVLFAAMSVTLNSASGPLAATVADRVTFSKRGTASAIGGLGNFGGGVLGAIIAGVAFGAIGVNSYFVIAAIVLVGAIGFFVFTKDRSSASLPKPSGSWTSVFKGFLVPLRSADFRWVWIARLLLTFGYATSTALNLYMLQSYVKPALSDAQATALTPVLAVIGLPFTVVGLVLAGRLSDKIGRRKPFVVLASLLMAAAFLVPVLSATVIGLIIAGILGGLAFGAYLSVDQALFIDVLPDMDSAGRDLGIAAVGSNLGQALGPIIAAQVVVITGGYQAIWIVAVVLVAIAGLAIIPVKTAR
jgi:MFS family permease